MKRLAFFVFLVMVGASLPSHAEAAPPPSPHVWIIVLENESSDSTFATDSPAPYLAHTLTAEGAFLREYYGTGHLSLDNYISMMSGQGPNPQTQGDCQYYTDFAGVAPGAVDVDGQAIGTGCVYPRGVAMFGDQLDAVHASWKGYMEDMGAPCRHPVLNTQDGTQSAKVGDQYAARHNPFVYFHSLIDDDTRCRAHVVDLTQLDRDLATPKTTPQFSFITPNLCHDGHDAPCVDGQPGGLESADAFLQEWVPKITSSPAFERDGILIVTFDESVVGSDAQACCNEPVGPNTPMPGITGPGGGRVGAVVLSPFVRPGTVTDQPYNHYSLLRSLEDLFDVDHLGYAARPDLRPFGTDVYTNGQP